jgi:hypothetical protein
VQALDVPHDDSVDHSCFEVVAQPLVVLATLAAVRRAVVVDVGFDNVKLAVLGVAFAVGGLPLTPADSPSPSSPLLMRT